MQDPTRDSRAFRVLVGTAAFVIVIGGLKLSGDILLPILFSAFLSVIALPLLRGLRRIGVPTFLAIPLVVLFVTASLVGITGVVAGTLRSFTVGIQKYEPQFELLVADTLTTARSFGVEVRTQDLTELIQPGAIMGLVGQTLNAVVGLFSRLVIVIVTMTFILFEASELALKGRVAFGSEARPAGPLTDVAATVQRYLIIKSLASLLTGVLVMIGTQALGLDFPVMWGLLAFLFNYVPSIGSIVAAIPPILLAIVQLGPIGAILVAVLYLVVNLSIGNFAEPRFMGRSLGLSPLVVFLSLIFWGWLWGPLGMLLCVPVTVIGKLILESNEDTRPFAVFLGSHRDAIALAREQGTELTDEEKML